MPPFLSLLVLDQRLRPWRCAAALLLFSLIVLIGSIPGARAEIGTVASGIVLHALAYSCITVLLYTGCAGTPAQRAAKAVLAVMCMGALDELVQSFLPYRHGAVADWAIDVGSAILTAGLLWALLPSAVDPRQV
ncbi:MAG: VanZ family protein [Pseudomonadota bacterium]